MRTWGRLLGKLVLVSVLAGCATASNPRDPFEGFNRAMFGFNDAIDKAAVKPAAKIYEELLPSFVQTAIGNFFGNIGDVWTLVNDILQGRGEQAASDFMRVTINSSFGLLGLIDVASDAGLTKHKEDFGQTLGTWGVASGPYVVLPVFGPSTMRDSIALPVDLSGDLWRYKHPVKVRNVGTVVRAIDNRAALLNATNLIEEAALDPYEFVRDAYMQRRQSMIGEGREPADSDK